MPVSDIKFLLRIPAGLDSELRKRAAGAQLSLNAMICVLLGRSVGEGFKVAEANNGDDLVRDVRADDRSGEQGSPVKRVRPTRPRKPPSKPGAVDRGVQQDAGGKGKGKEGKLKPCNVCGSP